jgi:putative methyltransferase (TIGR04325 family)
MPRLKHTASRLVRSLPLLSDCYHHFWSFRREVARCRGVYGSFAEARAAAPSSVAIGYEQEAIRYCESVAHLTARSRVGEMNDRDYPVLFWLRPLLADAGLVFDLGGNVGLQYFAYRAKTHVPGHVRWVVCEIPEVARAGMELAARREERALSFTTSFDEAERADILLSCGTLQYLDHDFAWSLGRLRKKPRHILLNRVPLYEGDTYVTLQNLGYAVTPYRVQNRRELLDSLTALGYLLVDTWKDGRHLDIPFHPKRRVTGYWGMYLTRDTAAMPLAAESSTEELAVAAAG